MKHCVAADEARESAALYALGALSQHEARAFEQHLAEGCEVCRAELQAFEEVAAKLAFGAPEAESPAGLREKLLSKVSEASPPQATPTTPPAASPQFLTVRATEGEWQEVGPGALMKPLFVDDGRGTITALIKLLPGGWLPRHRHTGVEESIVLEGDCRVNDQVLGPGDYRCAPAGSIDEAIHTLGGTVFMLVAPKTVEILE